MREKDAEIASLRAKVEKLEVLPARVDQLEARIAALTGPR